MSKIVGADLRLVNLEPRTQRVDAIQQFTRMEMPLVTLICDDGLQGTGYGYTIGTGGTAVYELLRSYVLPRIIGSDPLRPEAIWQSLYNHVRFVSGGPFVSAALSAADTAVWDLRAKQANVPLWALAGGAHDSLPLYQTEGGWLQLPTDQLVENARSSQDAGFGGFKIKVGKPSAQEDVARLAAVRDAVGPGYDIMLDANQAFSLDEAIRRAALFAPFDPTWYEEPMPADDVEGHARLVALTQIPVAVGETLFTLRQVREYLGRGACSVLQVDVGRIGGITPWLKAAHTAESYGIAISPHFLMELHVAVAAAVPNGRWVEYIPQLEDVATSSMKIENGSAYPSLEPGLGVEWNWSAIEQHEVPETRCQVG